MTFTPTDRATWPELLTLRETAAILRRSVFTIRKACTDQTMVPAPVRSLGRPYRWRRADVLRAIDGEGVRRVA